MKLVYFVRATCAPPTHVSSAHRVHTVCVPRAQMPLDHHACPTGSAAVLRALGLCWLRLAPVSADVAQACLGLAAVMVRDAAGHFYLFRAGRS